MEVYGSHSVAYLLPMAICLSIFITGCHGNSVLYRHPSVSNSKISVDKIVTLETDNTLGDKIVKIGIETVDGDTTQGNDVELENTSDLDDKKDNADYNRLIKMIKEMERELEDVRLTQEFQR